MVSLLKKRSALALFTNLFPTHAQATTSKFVIVVKAALEKAKVWSKIEIQRCGQQEKTKGVVKNSKLPKTIAAKHLINACWNHIFFGPSHLLLVDISV